MELSFYENLSKNQKIFADKIAERARAMGVPPELAVAVAFKESGLNPGVRPGSAGEVGIMQIKPTTAKEVGFSEEDIKDPEKNIDAGLKYLKKSLDMSEGDRRLAAAGYNAGINHPFFSSKDRELPEITVNYLRDLKGFGAFAAPAPSTMEIEPEPGMPATATKERSAVDKVFEDVARSRGELIGAGAGGAEAARRLAVPAAKGVARQLGEASEEGRIAAQRKLLAEDPRMSRILQGTIEPETGASGRARMTGFNIESAQQAARAKEAAQQIGALQQAGMPVQSPQSVLAQAPGMTASQSGVIYPRSAPAPVTPPSKGALEEVSQLFRNMMAPESKFMSVAKPLVKYGGPPLAGVQMGREFGSLSHEMDKPQPDYTKSVLHALGGLGAAGSVFPATAPFAIPAAIAAPMFIEAIEKGRERPLGQISDTIAP